MHNFFSYLKGTPSQGKPLSSSSAQHPKAYAEADWRNHPDTHRFTMGSCIVFVIQI